MVIPQDAALFPSDAYKLLVLLSESGGIDAIVTTNFDGMLEKAQQELGRDLFQIYAPGSGAPTHFRRANSNQRGNRI